MSEKEISPTLEPDTPATSQPDESQDGHSHGNTAVHTAREEARVVRKLDLNLMTLFFFLCEYTNTSRFTLAPNKRSQLGYYAENVALTDMLAFLDRSNIGNAKIAGMQDELSLDSEDYQWLLNIFYIAYVVCEFEVLLWKLFPPRIVGTIVVLGWGIIATVQAGVHSWGGLMALRFLLGAFEAAYG